MNVIEKSNFEKFYVELSKELECQMVSRIDDPNYLSKMGGETLEGIRYSSQPISGVHLSSSNYSLILNEISQNTIELHKIEILEKNRGKGLGTEIMNTILDMVDNYGLTLRLVPIPYLDSPFSKRIGLLNRLIKDDILRSGFVNHKLVKEQKTLIKKHNQYKRRMTQKLKDYYQSFGFNEVKGGIYYVYENEHMRLVA